MKTITDLSAVCTRLEEAARRTLPLSVTDPQEIYEHFEMLAVQTLDSEHADYPPGVLQGMLQMYLAELRTKLGVQ